MWERSVAARASRAASLETARLVISFALSLAKAASPRTSGSPSATGSAMRRSMCAWMPSAPPCSVKVACVAWLRGSLRRARTGELVRGVGRKHSCAGWEATEGWRVG